MLRLSVKLIKILIITVIFFASLALKGQAQPQYSVNNVVIDNSDSLVLIQGKGNFKSNVSNGALQTYSPIEQKTNSSINLINSISTMTLKDPSRYVIDIPNAVLIGSSRVYKVQNSSVLKSVSLSQFSTKPNIVRVVFMTQQDAKLSSFKTYSNGCNIVVSYKNPIVNNSIQRKFYTPSGNQDKTALNQNTGSILSYSVNNETIDFTPRLQTKYYLSKISQNSDGLILRGLGELAYQRAQYNADNTEAAIILDNAQLAGSLENKTYVIPSSNKNNKATLTLTTLNSRKVKLTLLGKDLRDYRLVLAPDSQSLFISHRTYIINTQFSSDTPKVNSYKMEKTANGYDIFSINFSQGVAYNVFELNDNFYLDINNLADYNNLLFSQLLNSTDVKIQVLKISSDKTRFIIPMKDENYSFNFSYANVESNSKSIKICFKRNSVQKPISESPIVIDNSKKENLEVIYVPKGEDGSLKNKKEKKNKDTQISSMKKVVIDPGHGGADSGALRGIYLEKNLNLAVAKLVAQKLEKKKIYVYMTRTKDTTLTLEDRVNFSNETSPDIYVSIHTNSTVAGDSFGLETHYYKDDSLELARTIHENFASAKNLKNWQTKDRGVIKSRFYVINHTEAPSVLIEIGFISNEEERAKLFTKERQEEIADSIVKGILEYLKVK